jgi:hypothetical protein
MIVGWRRVAVMDENTCKSCSTANGSFLMDANELHRNCDYVHSADDVISGLRCRCVAIPIYEETE